MNKIYLVTLCIFLISGCANNKYACGEIPTSDCTPLSTVYERTGEDYHDYREGLNNKKTKSKKKAVINISPTNRVLNYASPGDPILTNPVIMRVLYKSFENSQNDLDAGGYVYLKMRDSEWINAN